MDVIISPFSNSAIRDWPARNYSALSEILLEELPQNTVIRIIGTQSQALRADAIVRHLDADRVSNDCGAYPWPAVENAVRRAACVVGNNSGIAHLSARSGVPTVCIFGGSHQRAEWRPLGPHVTLISRAIWCSPCHLDRLDQCRHGKKCLTDIAADEVAAAVIALVEGRNGRTKSDT